MKKNRLYSLCMSSMIAAAIAVQVPIARAELIATDAVAQDTAAQDRAKIDAFLDRASVTDKLKAMGVSGMVEIGRAHV